MSFVVSGIDWDGLLSKRRVENVDGRCSAVEGAQEAVTNNLFLSKLFSYKKYINNKNSSLKRTGSCCDSAMFNFFSEKKTRSIQSTFDFIEPKSDDKPVYS